MEEAADAREKSARRVALTCWKQASPKAAAEKVNADNAASENAAGVGAAAQTIAAGRVAANIAATCREANNQEVKKEIACPLVAPGRWIIARHEG